MALTDPDRQSAGRAVLKREKKENWGEFSPQSTCSFLAGFWPAPLVGRACEGSVLTLATWQPFP